MKEVKEKIIYLINDLDIKSDLKDKLLWFNEKIMEVKKNNCLTKFDVIIDDLSNDEINILLEYITKILEEHNLFNEFQEYNGRNLDDLENSCLIIKDFNKIKEDYLDCWRGEERFNNFYQKLKINNNMIIFASINKIENYLKNNKTKVFDPNLSIHLYGNYNEKDLYKKLIEKYESNNIKYKLSCSTFKKILKEINSKNYLKNFDKVDYLYDYSIKKMILSDNNIVNENSFKDLIKNNNKEKKLTIDDLVGLSNIGEEFDKLYKYLEFSKKIKSKDNIYLNLFFLGNPGTGKTTVAKIYKDKLYELKIIKEDKLIEVTANDLIGEYIGETKNIVRSVLEKSKNGVLFIDEAYLLYNNGYRSGNNPYMDEAIVELMKYLEDSKNIVIFAGYTNETRNLYNANPGLKSRIYKEIIFEDYNISELYEILENELKKNGLKIDSKSKNKIISYIYFIKNGADFGNARTMKQLAQKMIMEHASRTSDLLITHKDLPLMEINKNLMGVGIYDR